MDYFPFEKKYVDSFILDPELQPYLERLPSGFGDSTLNVGNEEASCIQVNFPRFYTKSSFAEGRFLHEIKAEIIISAEKR